MSGLSSRLAKLRTAAGHYGPPRPVRVGTVMLHASSGAERAASIAREDAAREAAGRLPHSMLGFLGTSTRFRVHAIPRLTTFADDTP